MVEALPFILADDQPTTLCAGGARLASEFRVKISREGFKPGCNTLNIMANFAEAELLQDEGIRRIGGAKEQGALPGGLSLNLAQHLAVERDLHDVAGLGTAGELRIPRLVVPRPPRGRLVDPD
jgi:hypothetical protein